jgi:hypothetical protein
MGRDYQKRMQPPEAVTKIAEVIRLIEVVRGGQMKFNLYRLYSRIHYQHYRCSSTNFRGVLVA